MNSRFFKIVDQQIDMFIEVCRRCIKDKGLDSKIWVIKDEEASVVGIGDPDKLMHNKDFGFVFYYEMIISRPFEDAVDEFKFKLDHFIKTAKLTGKFAAFNDEKKQPDQKD